MKPCHGIAYGHEGRALAAAGLGEFRPEIADLRISCADLTLLALRVFEHTISGRA
jgi:hypothetical protein